LGISFACTIALNQFFAFEYSDRFFATYFFYFVLGMFLAKRKDCEQTNISIFIKSGILLIVSVFHLSLSYVMSIGEMWYRSSPFWQVVFSMLVILVTYGICKKTKDKSIDKITGFFNPHTFSIFLYHIFIIHVLQFVIYPHFNFTIKLKFLITSVVVCSIITLYCFIMNKIKNRIKE
jgi:peptidoglycan/LPS O-acetylase OafA/YrhL